MRFYTDSNLISIQCICTDYNTLIYFFWKIYSHLNENLEFLIWYFSRIVAFSFSHLISTILMRHKLMTYFWWWKIVTSWQQQVQYQSVKIFKIKQELIGGIQGMASLNQNQEWIILKRFQKILLTHFWVNMG